MRWRAIRLIGVRGFRSALRGFGVYGIAFLSLVVVALSLNAYVGAIEENGLMILPSPLDAPFSLAVTLGGIYLAIAASISISRERDLGTLEVLFYGPVDTVSYVLAKYLENILVFIAIMVFYVIGFLMFARLGNFGFPGTMAAGVVLAIALASSITSFGILVSSLTNRIRTSILVLLALVVLFLGIQWGESFLAGLDPNSISPAVFYGKSLVSFAARIVSWVSPFSYLSRGMQASSIGDIIGYVRSFIASLVYSGVLLSFSVIAFRKKGVRS